MYFLEQRRVPIRIEFLDSPLPHNHTTDMVDRWREMQGTLHCNERSICGQKRLGLRPTVDGITRARFCGHVIPDFNPIRVEIGGPSHTAGILLESLPIGLS